jgi:phage-related protein
MSVHALSFTYNGLNSLYDFGLILAGTDSESQGISYTATKSELSTYRPRTTLHNKRFADVMQFDLCVMKCDGRELTQTQARKIVSWITSPSGYLPLTVQDFKDTDYHHGIVYFATCTGYTPLRPRHPSEIVGYTFHFECNAPYGYSEKRIVEIDTDISDTYEIQVSSDIMGEPIYPKIHITPSESGILTFSNSAFPGEIFTLNVISGNFVQIDGETGIISDFAAVIDYDNDTNLAWLKLADGLNTITITGSCTGEISYREPRQVNI